MNYGPNTRFILLNKTVKDFEYQTTNLSSRLGYTGDQNKGFRIVLTKDAEPKILVQNCASDEKGNSLDVVMIEIDQLFLNVMEINQNLKVLIHIY